MSSSTTPKSIESIALGPSGRAVAEPIELDLLNGLQHHLNMERQAHATYFAAAIWFAERELRGFSSFFRNESASEHDHAAKFAEYLIARGQSVQLLDIKAPVQSWSEPEDVMATSFLLEADVTASLQQLYAMAERASDTRTTVFLDPMVDQQTQAEHEVAHLLGRDRYANKQATAILLIDGELEQGRHRPASLQSNGG